MSGFEDLLQDAEQLTAQIDKENANNNLPRLQRTLSQLVEANRRKLAKTSNYMSSETNEISASILLAGKGIDAPRLTQSIDNLNIMAQQQQQQKQQDQQQQLLSTTGYFNPYDKFASLEQLRDIDLQSFLKNEKDQCMMSIIDDTRRRTMQDIEDSFLISNELEWNKQKQRIMNELLGSFSSSSKLTNAVNTSISVASAANRTINQSKAGAPGSLTDVEMEFAKQIYAYNLKVIGDEQQQLKSVESSPDLLASLLGLVQRMNDKNIEEAWDILNFMTSAPRNRTDYDTNQESRVNLDRDTSVEMQSFFVRQAQSYLEHSCKELVKNTVSANLKQAKLGGSLGTLSLVNGYLRLSQSEKYHQFSSPEEVFDDKQPIWPTIYLCLRCGDVEAARQVAIKTRKEDIAAYLDEILKNKTNSSMNGISNFLSSTSENKLKLEYKSLIRRGSDLYKRAVYCYLCKQNTDEDSSLNDILDNVDDFLWFKLNTIQLQDAQQQVSTVRSNQFTSFQEFQTQLSVEYGEKYFIKSNRNPFIYLHVLLLTAQFEQAIELLLKYESCIVHGIHMALSLFERRMLNVIKSTSSTQLFASPGANEVTLPKSWRRVNLASLVKMYTRGKFELSGGDCRDSLEYYYFLRNLYLPLSAQSQISSKTKTSITYFTHYVSELAIETREFELLFGRLESRTPAVGSLCVRRPGAIDKYTRDEDETNMIIGRVGEEMEAKGLLEEAVKLYDLSRQQQRVLELCSKLISQVCADMNVLNSNRDRLKNLATAIATRYKTEMMNTTSNTSATNLVAPNSAYFSPVPKSVTSTFFLLTDLMTFFDLFHSENWDLAYETLSKLNILPSNSSNVEIKVKDFVAFNEEIKRNFPDIILAAMTIISNLYAQISRTSNKLGTSYQSLESSMLAGNDEKRMILNDLKEHAKALIKFVGCIPYRLSGDINARLLQLEVMMN